MYCLECFVAWCFGTSFAGPLLLGLDSEVRTAARDSRTETMLGFLVIAVTFHILVKAVLVTRVGLRFEDRQGREVRAAARDSRIRLERAHMYAYMTAVVLLSHTH